VVRACFAIAVAITTPAVAAADSDDPGTVSARALHAGAGAGGYVSITGGDDRSPCSSMSAELFPGGRFGRLGLRLEAFGLGQVLPDLFLAGVAFEAAASRPRLQLILVATAGAGTDGVPAIHAGVQTQLWLLGPIAAAGDGGALLRIDGSDTELLLLAGLSLRLAQ
jgi:hypothetical protein